MRRALRPAALSSVLCVLQCGCGDCDVIQPHPVSSRARLGIASSQVPAWPSPSIADGQLLPPSRTTGRTNFKDKRARSGQATETCALRIM